MVVERLVHGGAELREQDDALVVVAVVVGERQIRYWHDLLDAFRVEVLTRGCAIPDADPRANLRSHLITILP